MPREFSKQQLEQILASSVAMGGERSPIHADDVYREGGTTYRVGDMLDAIKEETGFDYAKFLSLPEKRKRIIAERARKKVRQRARAREKEKRKSSPFRHDIEKRPMRVDDVVNYKGMAVSAADLNDKVRVLMKGLASTDLDASKFNTLIGLAIVMLKNDGKSKPKSDQYPDNAVVYCGTGPLIQDCVLRENDGVQEQILHIPEKPGRATDRIQIDEAKAKIGIADIEAWIRKGEFKLEKPQGSSLHHLAEYSRVYGEGRFYRSLLPGGAMADLQDFVIEHNWSGAFAGATDFNKGDFRLPYSNCAFEFRISGFRLIMLYAQDETGTIGCDSALIGYREMWYLLPYGFTVGPQETGGKLILVDLKPQEDECIPRLDIEECRKLYELANAQVRACGIMLEAEVAVVETVRAPHKLNAHREYLGRAKLRDHHVVVLSKRRRTTPLPAEFKNKSEEKRSSPRLHFRIGHWRHFTNHRTWIKWQLIGDPDLGFVDKHYRL